MIEAGSLPVRRDRQWKEVGSIPTAVNSPKKAPDLG
jgi:hypothetical protein